MRSVWPGSAGRRLPRAGRLRRWGLRTLQALVGRLQTLQAMHQAECNRRDVAHASVADSLERVMADLDKAIEQVRAQIAKTIDDDPDLRERAQAAAEHSGLGDKTIPQLLAFIGRPQRFKSVKALIAYASLAPSIEQSGTSVNRRRSTHPMGHQDLKQALVLPGPGGRALQPCDRGVLEASERAGQAWQGCGRGLHAQAFGHRLRRSAHWQVLRSRVFRRLKQLDTDNGVFTSAKGFSPSQPGTAVAVKDFVRHRSAWHDCTALALRKSRRSRRSRRGTEPGHEQS